MSVSALGRLELIVGLLATTLWTTSALAATVVLVRPSNPAPGMTKALVRINGELVSAGFDVAIVDGTGGESRSWLEQLAARRGADAVVAMIGDKAPDSVEVWVIDKVTGKSVVRQVPFQPLSATGSEILAIRAVELLRASFVEIALSSSTRSAEGKPAPSPTVLHFVEIERKAPPKRFAAEVGGAAGLSGSVGPTILPILRFHWMARPWFVTQVTVAGLGNRPTVEAGVGSAQVAQEFATLGARYRVVSSKRLMPFFALSAGAIHTSVEGRANLPLQGRHVSQWSLLLDGEIGADWALQERFYLSLSLHAQVAEPYPVIRFDGAAVAVYGRPSILLALTIGAWL